MAPLTGSTLHVPVATVTDVTGNPEVGSISFTVVGSTVSPPVSLLVTFTVTAAPAKLAVSLTAFGT